MLAVRIEGDDRLATGRGEPGEQGGEGPREAEHPADVDALRERRLEPLEQRFEFALVGLQPVELTPKALALLEYLMLHPDKVISKTELTEHIYDQDFDRDSNLIEVYVRRLREKIGRARIETRRGQGYVFRS